MHLLQHTTTTKVSFFIAIAAAASAEIQLHTAGFGLNRDSVAMVQKILYVEIYQYYGRRLR